MVFSHFILFTTLNLIRILFKILLYFIKDFPDCHYIHRLIFIREIHQESRYKPFWVHQNKIGRLCFIFPYTFQNKPSALFISQKQILR